MLWSYLNFTLYSTEQSSTSSSRMFEQDTAIVPISNKSNDCIFIFSILARSFILIVLLSHGRLTAAPCFLFQWETYIIYVKVSNSISLFAPIWRVRVRFSRIKGQRECAIYHGHTPSSLHYIIPMQRLVKPYSTSRSESWQRYSILHQSVFQRIRSFHLDRIPEYPSQR